MPATIDLIPFNSRGQTVYSALWDVPPGAARWWGTPLAIGGALLALVGTVQLAGEQLRKSRAVEKRRATLRRKTAQHEWDLFRRRLRDRERRAEAKAKRWRQ